MALHLARGARHEHCVRSLRVWSAWRVASGPDRGKHIRERSSMAASCPELLYPFRDRQCSGRHEHL
eukprot:2832066-Alexandrium_andersonii.AAC.1